MRRVSLIAPLRNGRSAVVAHVGVSPLGKASIISLNNFCCFSGCMERSLNKHVRVTDVVSNGYYSKFGFMDGNLRRSS